MAVWLQECFDKAARLLRDMQYLKAGFIAVLVQELLSRSYVRHAYAGRVSATNHQYITYIAEVA